MLGFVLALLGVLLAVHFTVRKFVTAYMLKKIQGSEDASYASAFRKNTRFYRSVFSRMPAGWGRRSRKSLQEVIDKAGTFVESLNDQFTNPSGSPRN